MNPDSPQPPSAGYPEGFEREARITAKLLGELTAEEAAVLEAEIARDPELARLEARLRKTLDCVRIAASEPMEPVGGASPLPRFSPERREQLLARLRAPRAKEGASAGTVIPVEFPTVEAAKPGGGSTRSSWLVLAACLVAMLTAAAWWVGSVDASRMAARSEVRLLARGTMSTSAAAPVNASEPQETESLRREIRPVLLSPVEKPVVEALAVGGPEKPVQQVLVELSDTLTPLAEVVSTSAQNTVVEDRLSSQTPPQTAAAERLSDLDAAVQTTPESVTRFQMQPQLMRRYGLVGTTKPELAESAARPETKERMAASATDGPEPLGYRLSVAQTPASGSLRGVVASADTRRSEALGESQNGRLAPLPAVALNAPQAAGGAGAFGGGGGGGAGELPQVEAKAPLPVNWFSGQDSSASRLAGRAVTAAAAFDVPSDARDRSRGGAPAEDFAVRAYAEVPARPVLTESLSKDQKKAKTEAQPEALARGLAESEGRLGLGDVPVLGKALSSSPTLAGTPAAAAVVERNWAFAKKDDAPRLYFNASATVDSFAFQQTVPEGTEAEVVLAEDKSKTILTNTVSQAAVPMAQPEEIASENGVSTFSLNVSDVSFKLAGASLETGQMPAAGSIRTEEFVNAFQYRDPEPGSGRPIGFVWERAQYPFAQQRDVLRLSVKTAATGRQAGRPLNVVLLLDASGSMERADRVATIRELLKVLGNQLKAEDRVSVVTFARSARLWVDGLPGSQAGELVDRVGELTPQGGTHLEEALNVGYETARKHFQADGINRLVLLTDGAANLGELRADALRAMVEANRKRGIALDCFGVGFDGYQDDLLEALSRNGDGRYGFVNSPEEAATGFVNQLAGALNVAASDVKVQVEFHPERVQAWRQIGYARHQLTREQFRDNTVDAAEIGAAESGNALYIIEPRLRGQGPVATVRVRFRDPVANTYSEHAWSVPFEGVSMPLEQASPSLRLATVAAALGEMLSMSPYASEVRTDRLLSLLQGVPDAFQPDPRPGQLERMVRQTQAILGR